MGNEMGNNNTTGLKEEESLTVEDPKGLSKETSSIRDVKDENHVAPGLEAKDFPEKANGFASDDPESVGDVSVDNLTPNTEEKEQSGDFPVSDSLAVGPNEEGNASSENQQVSLPNDDEDVGLIELNMDEIAPVTSENQVQKVASSDKKEEERVINSDFDTKSIPPHDLEPEKPESSECDQTELAKVHAEPSEPDTYGSSVGIKQVTGLSSACASTENGHALDTKVSENLEVSVVTESSTVTEKEIDRSLVEQEEAKEEKELCEEKFGPEDEDILINVLDTVSMQPNDPSDLGVKDEEVFSTKANLIRDDSSKSESESESESEPEPEAISATNSPNSHQEVDESEEKSIVSEETRLIGEVLENGEEKHDNNPTQPFGDSVTESEPRDSNAFQPDSITVEQKEVINPSIDALSEEAKVSEDHEAIAVISPKLETVPSQSVNADCSDKEEDSTEKRIVEETKDSSKIEPLYAIEIEQSETVQTESQPVQGNSGESTFGSTNLIAEIIVSMNELAFDSTSIKQCVEKPEAISSEFKASSRESVERLSTGSRDRFSTDSDRDSVQYAQMRKSPSFSLDLQDEARNEESEQTPLLYQDKATIETSRSCEDIVNTLTLNGYSAEEQAMPVEEKVVRLERSDSEKSKTPFLGFLKEDEEANVVVATPQRQSKAQREAKSVVSSSTRVTISSTSKGKEKRKVKSSLFGNCMCCATVIN